MSASQIEMSGDIGIVVTERTFWLKGIFSKDVSCAQFSVTVRSEHFISGHVNQWDAPYPHPRECINAGQREENVLCLMVTSVIISGRDSGANSPSSLRKVTDRIAFRGITGHGDYSTASQTFSNSDDLLVHTVGKHITCTIMIHLNSEILTGMHYGVIQGPGAYFHSMVRVWLAQWRPRAAVVKNMQLTTRAPAAGLPTQKQKLEPCRDLSIGINY